MVGFLIKKSFFDGWDHFIQLFFSNLASGILIVGTVFFVRAISTVPVYLFIPIAFLLLMILNTWFIGIAGMAYQWSVFSNDWKYGFKSAIRGRIGHIVLASALWLFILFVLGFAIPFYIQSKSFYGLFLSTMLFWLMAAIILAMQYFFPLALYKKEDSPFLTLKKCFAVEFSNKALTLFVSLRTVVDVALTICSCFSIPGFSGISLGHMDAVRLILMRYDYKRSHCIEKNKDVNLWDMFEEDRNNIGPRTIRGMIFPWKN